MIRAVIIGLIFLVLSCSTPAVEKPDPFIEKDKMVAIIYDLSLFNAVSNTHKAYLKQRAIVPVKTIYEWYEIDSLIFAKNDLYWASKPKFYLEIYQKVNDSLKQMKEHYDKQVQEELLRRKDSVTKSSKKNDIKPPAELMREPPQKMPLKAKQ